jgi:hypothetical protein
LARDEWLEGPEFAAHPSPARAGTVLLENRPQSFASVDAEWCFCHHTFPMEKQRSGKRRMRVIGRAEIPQEAFLALLEIK